MLYTLPGLLHLLGGGAGGARADARVGEAGGAPRLPPSPRGHTQGSDDMSGCGGGMVMLLMCTETAKWRAVIRVDERDLPSEKVRGPGEAASGVIGLGLWAPSVWKGESCRWMRRFMCPLWCAGHLGELPRPCPVCRYCPGEWSGAYCGA